MKEQILETIENALIEGMAEEIGVRPFQMKSMIMRCEELKEFFEKTRSEAIKNIAENIKAKKGL